jgi:hypothetical protein
MACSSAPLRMCQIDQKVALCSLIAIGLTASPHFREKIDTMVIFTGPPAQRVHHVGKPLFHLGVDSIFTTISVDV